MAEKDPKNNKSTPIKPIYDIDILPDPSAGLDINLDNEGPIAASFGNTDFGESKYDDPNMSSIDILSGAYQFKRGDEQWGISKVLLGIPRAATKAAIEFAKTPGYLYSLGEWAFTDATLSDALDNAYLNALEDAEDWIKKDLMPVYDTYRSKHGDFWDQVLSGAFVGRDVADGVGYMLGLTGPNFLLRGVGIAGKLAKLGVSPTATQLSKAVAKNANNIELGTQAIINSGFEAAAETKGLVDRLKEMGVPKDQINDAALRTFKANMALLLVPNALANKALLGRFSKDKTTLMNYFDKSGELLAKPISMSSRFKDYGKAAVVGIGSEGFLEEGSQTTIENYEVNRAKGLADPNWFVGFAQEYINTLTTDEGKKSILLGGIIGAPTQLVGKKRERNAIKKASSDVEQLLKNKYNGYTAKTPFVRDENDNLVLDENNELVIDLEKAKEGAESHLDAIITEQLKDQALITNNQSLYEHLDNISFAKVALELIKQGEMGLEALNHWIDKAASTRDMADAKMMAESQGRSFSETQYKADKKAKAKELQEIYQNTEKISDNIPFNSLKVNRSNIKQYQKFVNDIVNSLYLESAKQSFYKDKWLAINNELEKLQHSKEADLPSSEIRRDQLVKEAKTFFDLLESSKNTYKSVFDKTQLQNAFDSYLKENRETEESAEEVKKDQEQQAKQSKEDSEVTSDDAKLAEEKNKVLEKAARALELTKDQKDEFDKLFYELEESSHMLDADDRQALLTKKQLLEDELSKDKPKGKSKDKKVAEGKPKDKPVETDAVESQELVGKEDTIHETQEISEQDINVDLAKAKRKPNLSRSIKSVVNDVMMHLFEHLFYKDKFRFEHNEDGFPLKDNASNVSIDALNRIKEGDTVEIRLTSVTDKNALKQLETDKNKALENDYVKPEDFDNEHLGIYLGDELIGFVRQPYHVEKPKDGNLEDAIKTRQSLIDYRKAVIVKLKAGKPVKEKVLTKGVGNLYTKIKVGEDGRLYVDADRNVISTGREKDKVNGSFLFVHADKDGRPIIPKGTESTLSPLQLTYFKEILNAYPKNFGKPGKVYQLVQDTSNTNNNWSLIPVYKSKIDNFAATEMLKVIDTFDNKGDYMQLVEALNDYIYASVKDDRATLYISRDQNGEVKFKISAQEFSLKDIKGKKRDDFKELLMSKRQNIATAKVNNIEYQEQLSKRKALVSNVYEHSSGEYFVQPYIEYSQALLEEDTPKTKSKVKKEATGPATTKKKSKIKKDVPNADPDEAAFSLREDNTPLNRSNIDKWLSKHLPQFKLSDIKVLADLKSNITDIYGMFKDMTIYLFEGSGEKTAYHEAFHGVFRNLLDRDSRHALIAEAIGRYERPTLEQLGDLKDRFPNTTAKQLSYLYYEEKMADEFAEYTYKQSRKSLGQKIKEFFQKLFGLYRLFNEPNQNAIDNLFFRINAGDFKSAPIQVAKPDAIDLINRPFEYFVNEEAYKESRRKKLNTVFGSSTAVSNVVSSIGNEFLARYQELFAKGEEVSPDKVFQDLLNSYKDYIENNDENSKHSIHANRVVINYIELLDEIKKYLSNRGIKVNQKFNWADEDSFEIEATKEDPTESEISKDEGLSVEGQAVSEGESTSTEDADIQRDTASTTKGYGEYIHIPGISSASTRLKIFLSSIPVIKDGKPVKDVYGITQYHDFNSLYYYIERNLVDEYTFEDQMVKLHELSLTKPEIKSVMVKLGVEVKLVNIANEQYDIVLSTPPNMTEEEHELIVNDFKSNFSKQHMNFLLVQFDINKKTGATSYRVFSANRRGIKRETLTQWESNLVDSSKDTIADINEEEGTAETLGTEKAKKLLERWNNISKGTLSVDQYDHVLSKLGIEMSPEVIDSLLQSNTFKKDVSNILEYHASKDPTTDQEKNARLSKLSLADYETNVVFNNYTTSFNNVENENIFSLQLPSYASKLLAKLKTRKSVNRRKLINELQQDEYYKHSNLLNLLKSNDRFATELFNMYYTDGLKDKRGSRKGVKVTDQTSKDHALMQIALFQNRQGKTEEEQLKRRDEKSGVSIPTAKYTNLIQSDKTLLTIFEGVKYRVNLEKIDDRTSEVTMSSDIVGKYYNLVLSEISRIKRSLDMRKDILTNKDLSKYKLNMLMEYGHLSGKSWDAIQPYIKKQNKEGSLSVEDWNKVQEIFTFDGKAFKFNQFTNSNFNRTLIDRLDLYKILESNDDIESALETIKVPKTKDVKNKNFTYKDYILKLLTVELTQEFERVRDEFLDKGIIQLESVKKGSPLLLNSSLIELEGKKPEERHEELTNLIASYALNHRLMFNEVSSLLNGDPAFYKPGDIQKRVYQSQSQTVNQNFKDKTARARLIEDVEGSTWDQSIADTLKEQGFIDEEVNAIYPFKKGYGETNSTDAQVFSTPLFWKKWHISRGTWDKIKQLAYDVGEGKISISKLTKADREAVILELSPIKPFYAGMRYDEELGQMRYEQVKCIIMPLFKTLIRNNELLKEKREEMERNTDELLIFGSAFKAHTGYKDDIVSFGGRQLELDLDNFGTQVDNPQHLFEEENNSLRQLKMLLSGVIEPDKIYNGKKGSQILDEIMSMESENLDMALEVLNKKLDPKNKGFLDFIKDALTKRGATTNLEEIFQIENGEFIHPLDNGNISRSTENMLSSIFTKKVVRQGFGVGGSAVQMSSLGFFSDYKNLKAQQEALTSEQLLKQDELKWIKPDGKGGIEYAEAYLPAWSKKFFDEEGFLKNIDDIPTELRELIIYRIPTEGLHSMLPIRVKGFLPEAIGNVILLPHAVVTQFGSDFDFDKTYFFGKEFYSKGNKYIPYTYTTDTSESAIKDRYEQYVEYEKSHKRKYVSLDKFRNFTIAQQNVSGARNNRIIDNYLHILTAVENLKLIVKPSGFKKLVDIKNQIQKYTDIDPALFFSSTTQRDLKDRNHTGLALKGQSALHVSGHSYAVLMDLTTKMVKDNGRLVKSSAINFNGLHATFDNIYEEVVDEEGNIELIPREGFTKRHTLDGNLIADELGSIMAAILDDIKSPILATLGINKHTIDVLCTIVRAGYNIETALKFVAQPGVKHLSKLLDTNVSKIKTTSARLSTEDLIKHYTEELEATVKSKKDEIESIKKEIDPDNTSKISELNKTLKKLDDIVITSTLGYGHNLSDDMMSKVLDKYKIYSDKIIDNLNRQEKIEYYSTQLKVLQEFKNIEAMSKELVNINKFFAINKEVGPNVEDIISKKEILNKIENNHEYIRGFDIEKIPTLNSTWKVHEAALEYFENYFPYSTDYYMTLKNAVATTQLGKTLDMIDVDTRVRMNGFIRAFTDTFDGGSFAFDDGYDYTRYLYLNGGFPTLLKNIKKVDKKTDNTKHNDGKTYAQIRNNAFIRALEVRWDFNNKINIIALKGHSLDLETKNNLIEAFKTLYYTKSTRDIAISLIDYSFVYSGFYTGVQSYSQLIPVEVLADLEYSRYRKQLIQSLKQKGLVPDKVTIDRLIDQIVRNFPRDFTKVFDSEMFNVQGKLPDTIEATPEDAKLHGRYKDFIVSKDDAEIPARYIRVFDSSEFIMKLYKNIPGTYEFEYIDNLGIPGRAIEIDSSRDIAKSAFNINWIGVMREVPNDKPVESSKEAQKVDLEKLDVSNVTEESFNNIDDQAIQNAVNKAIKDSGTIPEGKKLEAKGRKKKDIDPEDGTEESPKKC